MQREEKHWPFLKPLLVWPERGICFVARRFMFGDTAARLGLRICPTRANRNMGIYQHVIEIHHSPRNVGL